MRRHNDQERDEVRDTRRVAEIYVTDMKEPLGEKKTSEGKSPDSVRGLQIAFASGLDHSRSCLCSKKNSKLERGALLPTVRARGSQTTTLQRQ